MGIGVSKCWRINSLARAVSRASTAASQGLVLIVFILQHFHRKHRSPQPDKSITRRQIKQPVHAFAANSENHSPPQLLYETA
ncbi:Uncharacterised protein [Escherichia coli]|uniref:Uncharacterized protein n=1 Tax=Escherichia coli TaxID=562 RepID=A0A377AJA8_ECOLX|nr:Uncharacterised protein [Escherichia coli]